MNLQNFKKYLISAIFLFVMNGNCFSAQDEDKFASLIKNNPDHLIFGVPSQFNFLDPTFSMSAQTKYALQLVFEPLVRINSRQELEPVLAKSWNIEKKGKAIIISIQRNHHFSDGSEVTADDVVNSIVRMCKADSKSRWDLEGLVGCSSKLSNPNVKKLDKYRIEFQININPTTFLFHLSTPRVVIVKTVVNGLLGSGPYILNQRDDDYLVLNKNLYYEQLKEIKNPGLLLFHINEKDITSWIKTKPLDGTIMYSINGIMSFYNKQYLLTNEPLYTTEILVLNNQRFPFNIKKVRQALLAEIYNRNKIHRSMHGLYKAYGIIPVGIGGTLTNTAPKQLTEITTEEVFNLVPKLKNEIYNVVIHRHIALKNDYEGNELIAAAKKYHINISYKYHQNYSTLWPLYLNHQLDGFVEFFDTKSREAFTVLKFFMSNSPENYSNTRDAKLDLLLEQALMTFSSHERYKRYQIVNKYLLSEAVVIPFYYMGHSNIINNCLGGITDKFYFNPFQYLANTYRQNNCAINSAAHKEERN